ncbi:MAG TPA: flagellar biosynthesis protein FlhB [Longimicrobiaceae bacterium]|nr:flagellar biosynthesis protein FlhB [Longimicrobiaceae bacterium]
MGEKTEAPTAKRRQDTRDKGEVPKSQELNTAILLLGAALVLNTAGPGLSSTVRASFEYGILATGAGQLDGPSAVELIRIIGWKVLASLGVFLLSLGGIALVITTVQARGILSLKPLGPNFGKMNPLTNAKRSLGIQPWAELVKSLAKMLIVGVAIYFALKAAWPASMALSQQSPVGILHVVQQYSVSLLVTAGVAYLAFAAADYLYQLWQHEKGLKMSKEEIKQEYKQSDGDPMVKQRMRSAGRALARRQMFGEVPNADVVITNPTHIAVALKYNPETLDAPVVLAMGQRKVAERIKGIARDANVPMVENRPLARALLASARVGDEIPAELYMAVAEVLAFVINQRAVRTPSWQGSAEA